MKSRIFALTGLLMSCCIGFSNPTDSLKTTDSTAIENVVHSFPYQVTFISPMGTNGMHSADVTNHLSLNIVAGYNGGLSGFEVGGFANVLKHDARGTQVAGFANVVKGSLNGIQIAGFGNVAQLKSSGVQIAGFSNQASSSMKGMQVGGFSNQAIGAVNGGQIAGFGNYSSDSVQGFQVAGFANHAGGESKGIQVAGFMNCSNDLQGGQVAGFTNVAGNMEGTQVAGFLNRADTVRGLQIGFINLADTFESGVPIGFFSNVSNGYRSFSIGANELGWITGEFHIGVPKFYNIFSLGIGPIPGSASWAYGYGVGTRVIDRTKSKVSLEGSAYHVNEGELWNNANNMLIRFQPKYEYHPSGGRFALWVGPSLNMMVSGKWDGRGETFESDLAPYEALKDNGKYNVYRFWAGGQLGVKF